MANQGVSQSVYATPTKQNATYSFQTPTRNTSALSSLTTSIATPFITDRRGRQPKFTPEHFRSLTVPQEHGDANNAYHSCDNSRIACSPSTGTRKRKGSSMQASRPGRKTSSKNKRPVNTETSATQAVTDHGHPCRASSSAKKNPCLPHQCMDGTSSTPTATEPQAKEAYTSEQCTRFTPDNILDFGLPECRCPYCGAMFWYAERLERHRHTTMPIFALCCNHGKVSLPLLRQTPAYLDSLLNVNGGSEAKHFRKEVRPYNGMFSMSSIGAKLDRRVTNSSGPYSFIICGANYHHMGSLLPPEGKKAKFSQLYVFDTDNEVADRLSNFSSTNLALKPHIVDGLIKMFDQTNELVKSFRRVAREVQDPANHNLRLRITGNRETNNRQYDLPTGSDVAGLIPGDFSGEDGDRDIIINHREEGLQRINSLNPKFHALQFPVLFPYGEDGFHLGIQCDPVHSSPTAKRKNVTEREFHAFRLQHRQTEGQSLMRGGKALQHYCVDAFATIEQNRLKFLRSNQKLLRAELYKGLCDAYSKGDTSGKDVGTILPATYTGGPRYMKHQYLDAMAICQRIGNPDLFITFTCNAQWPEITKAFQEVVGVKPEDKPDIVVRVFRMKVVALKEQIHRYQFFGKSVADIHTIEFQKRGLPHVHLLVWLDQNAKLKTTEAIDATISAELPDSEKDPLGYATVGKFMLHGPCGQANHKSPCMVDGKCKKFFPKAFNATTTYDHNGYIVYRRRNDGRTFKKGNVILDNRYVVPYNRNLLVMFQAHINVEVCHKGRLIKYLFKYVTKGPDRATVVAENCPTQQPSDSPIPTRLPRDEIKQYLDCRVLSSFEAMWRVYEFPIHERTPSVVCLPVHLKDQQSVAYDPDASLRSVVEDPEKAKTMLTEYFTLNRMDERARSIMYADIPTNYTFHLRPKHWAIRKQGNVIGRIVFVPPGTTDVYFLRMLLTKVSGATSFEDLMTVDGHICKDYQDACMKRGFLIDDDEPQATIGEVGQWGMPALLRSLFVMILLHSEVADPRKLFEANWKLFADDFSYQTRRGLALHNFQPPPEYLQNEVLKHVETLLHSHSKTLQDYNLPLPTDRVDFLVHNRLICEQLNYDVCLQRRTAEEIFATLNRKQTHAYHNVLNSVAQGLGKFFFLYGHGGTGKTYLYNTIIATLRSQQKIVLVVASSGIAATLLPDGSTGHSRFKIPIDIDASSICKVKKGTHLAQLLQQTSLIVWDEAPMTHRFCFEALDRTLCDIMDVPTTGHGYKPFGGKTILLGGDFRQILPVIPGGGREETLNASIVRSTLWMHCELLCLNQNMRINHDAVNESTIFNGSTFSQWVLSVGNGLAPVVSLHEGAERNWMRIPQYLMLPLDGSSVTPIVDFVFDGLLQSYRSVNYLKNRAIVTPTNETVSQVNSIVLSCIPEEAKTYYSLDSLCSESTDSADVDALYPTEFLNSLSFNGMPEHELTLKLYTPIMVLRNIDPPAGLCNGTRLMVTQLGDNVIKGLILTGANEGTVVAIPRIALNLSDKKWPFTMKRRQFPVRLCYAMTINKSQGQTLERAGVFLPKPVFSHGQLYVAISRVRSAKGLRFLIHNDGDLPSDYTKNVVYSEVYTDLSTPGQE